MYLVPSDAAPELRRIEHIYDSGQFQAALQAVEDFEQQTTVSPTDQLTGQLLKSILLNEFGRYEESLRLAETVFKESQRIRNRLHVVDALIAVVEALRYLERFDEGLTAIEQGEHELNTLARDQPAEVPLRKAMLMRLKGFIYIEKGYLDRAWEYSQQSLVLVKEIGHKREISESLRLISYIYRQKGELEHALDYSQQSLALAEEIDHKLLIAFSLWMIGIVYREKGEFDRALENFQQGIVLAREFDQKRNIASVQDNIGEIYRQKGELEQALECFQQYLAYGEKLDRKTYQYALSLESIGLIYWQKGELEQALEYLEQSLIIAEEFGHNLWTSEPLFHLISVTIDMDSLDQAHQYLQRLQQLNEQEDNKIISQRCRVAEALVLKTSPRPRHRGKAEEIFEQVAAEEVVDHEVTVVALLNLCDLLLDALRSSDSLELMSEIHSHVNRLQGIAKQQYSHWLLVETYVLQAKLALIELKLEDARRLLAQAQQIAERHGLHRLATQISSDYTTLLDQLSQWEALIDRNASMVERMELAHLEAQVMRMIHKRAKEIPDKIVKGISKSFKLSQTAISKQIQPLSLTDRILRHHPQLESDAIATAIIRCLETNNRLNISQLAEEVRKQRGRASRQTIRERANRLISQGILEEVDEGYGRQLRIRPLFES